MAQKLDSLKDISSPCSSFKAVANLERQQHISWIRGEADALFWHSHMPVNRGP